MQSELVAALKQWQQDPSGKRVVHIQIGSQSSKSYVGYVVSDLQAGICGIIRNINDLEMIDQTCKNKLMEHQKK